MNAQQARGLANSLTSEGVIEQLEIVRKEISEADENQLKRIIVVRDYFGEDDYTELNSYTIPIDEQVGDGKKYGDELICIRPIEIECPTCGLFH